MLSLRKLNERWKLVGHDERTKEKTANVTQKMCPTVKVTFTSKSNNHASTKVSVDQ